MRLETLLRDEASPGHIETLEVCDRPTAQVAGLITEVFIPRRESQGQEPGGASDPAGSLPVGTSRPPNVV